MTDTKPRPATWTEHEVDVVRVYDGGTLRGYLWRGVREPAIGFIRQDDSPKAVAASEAWNAAISAAMRTERFTTAGFFAYWAGFEDGPTRVDQRAERTTLKAIVRTVTRS